MNGLSELADISADDPAITATLNTSEPDTPDLPPLEEPPVPPPEIISSEEAPGTMHRVLAAINADPQDLRRYRISRLNGASEQEALRVGDNGVGKWGDVTATYKVPYVSLPSDTPGIAHNRLVKVTTPRGSIVAKVGDVLPPSNQLQGRASIDLNPATAMAVGHPGGVTPVEWHFVDGGMGDASQTPNLTTPSSINIAPQPIQPSGYADLPTPDVPSTLTSIGEEPVNEDQMTELPSGESTDATSIEPTPIPQGETGEPPIPKSFQGGRVVKVLKDGGHQLDDGRIGYRDGTVIATHDGVKYSMNVNKIGDKWKPLPGQKGQHGLDTATFKELNQRNLAPIEGETKTAAWQRINKADKESGAQEGHIFESLPAEGKMLAKHLSDYTMDSGQAGRYMSAKDPQGRKILAAAYELNPNFDSKEYGAKKTYLRDFRTGGLGTPAGQIKSLNRLVEHINTLDQLAKSLPGGTLTPKNTLANWFNTTTGKAYQKQFETAQTAVIGEMAKLITQGVPSNWDQQKWESSLGASSSKEQLLAVIHKTLPDLVAGPLEVLKEDYKRNMGKEAEPGEVVFPHSEKLLKQMGINLGFADTTPQPSDLSKMDIKAGDIVKDANGRTIRFKGGDKFDKNNWELYQ